MNTLCFQFSYCPLYMLVRTLAVYVNKSISKQLLKWIILFTIKSQPGNLSQVWILVTISAAPCLICAAYKSGAFTTPGDK